MPETLPLPYVPTEAADIISFDGETHGPAVIRYNVPLPGRYTGQRIVRLDLGLTSDDFNEEYVSGVTESIKALDWKKPANSQTWTYNADSAAALYWARLEDVRSSFTWVWFGGGGGVTGPKNPDGTLALMPPMTDEQILERVPDFLNLPPDHQAGIRRELRLPAKNWDGQMVMTTTTAETALGKNPSANLFLVETYGISSFLGDYGLGPTVRTFTLLPGEETKISIKTWRSTQSKVAEASSIVDSYTTEAGSRFTNTVQQETTDKANRQNKESWHEERYSPECVEGKF